ncbi:uncharacterized mitochondrial protein AtMg00810-like [Nicotiana tomentosiformis]|uniref:uncharacterized mitochondrial protein AtMg00810-like n=1 Tax=Nicotiana tomentosiformis TaxID=4098 RepID=UPI00388CA1A9
MEDCKEIDTHIATATKLDVDEPGSSVDQKLYRGMIGSLLYLTASIHAIVFNIGLCARFEASPKESHLTVVKRILRYLKGTTDLCLWYTKGSDFNLVGYVNTEYAGFLVDRKSTSDMARLLGLCLVSWTTERQNFVALSTAEAEYVVVASCCAQLLWIKHQLMDFGIDTYTSDFSVKNLVRQDYLSAKRNKCLDSRDKLQRLFKLISTLIRLLKRSSAVKTPGTARSTKKKKATSSIPVETHLTRGRATRSQKK